PRSIDSVVVLPAPLPPSSAVVVPARTAKEMPLTASTLPYDLNNRSTTIAAFTSTAGPRSTPSRWRAPGERRGSALDGLPAVLRQLAHGRHLVHRLPQPCAVFHRQLELVL